MGLVFLVTVGTVSVTKCQSANIGRTKDWVHWVSHAPNRGLYGLRQSHFGLHPACIPTYQTHEPLLQSSSGFTIGLTHPGERTVFFKKAERLACTGFEIGIPFNMTAPFHVT